MKIIKILLLIMIVSLFSMPTIATPFDSPTGTAGSIGVGNGYFDNDNSVFNLTSSRNIFAVAEQTEIFLVEPVGFPIGLSNAYTLVTGTSLRSAMVASDGYLYFVDTNGIKKKRARNSATPVGDGGSSTTADVLLILSSPDIYNLKELDNNIYFLDAGTLKHFALSDDLVTTDFAGITTNYAKSGFGIMHNSSTNVLTVITAGSTSVSTPYRYTYYYSNSTAQNNAFYGGTGTAGFNVAYDHDNTSVFVTSNYLYVRHTGVHHTGTTYANFTEDVIFYENLTVKTPTPTGLTSGTALNRSDIISNANIGSNTDIVLYARADNNQYDIFNFLEHGSEAIPLSPAQLTYDTKTIASLDSQYYNKSTIYLEYNVILNTLNANNLLLDFGDYRWMITMTDPNGVTTDIIQSPACSYSSVLDTTCQVTSTMGIRAPPAGWLQGSWNAKLYEINIVNPNRALLTTSSAFTVLNTTIENQSVIPPPDTNLPTSGTAPQAISLIDGFVNWLGMGVNSVSKLLFAMIFVAIAATVGLVWGNGNVAMVFAFVPYAFFTFIDYIPKWVFIIAILLIAIASRAFR